MNKVTLRLGIHRIASLALLCFSLGGCAAAVACEPVATPNRIADAGAICRDTMGLSPSNVPFDSCVQSLLQNLTALKQPSLPEEPIAMVALPESDTQKSCVLFGLAPGSKALDVCAGNLDASLFEAADAAAR
jgi:hypothetical protein